MREAQPGDRTWLDQLPSGTREQSVTGDHGGMLERVRERWQGELEIDEARFLRRLADSPSTEESPGFAENGKHVADLYLASACAWGDDKAVALFEQTYRRELELAIKRSSAPLDPDDLWQKLMQRWFVGQPGQPPAIASYAGRSSLRTWVRTGVVNLIIDQGRGRDRGESPLDEQVLTKVAVPGDTPELDYVRRHYGEAFATSVEEALTQIGVRSRNIIRYHALQGLTIDEIGAIYGVHRTTAFRWVERARTEVLAATRSRLQVKLATTGDDVNSIMRALASQLHVSVRRLLASTVEAE